MSKEVDSAISGITKSPSQESLPSTPSPQPPQSPKAQVQAQSQVSKQQSQTAGATTASPSAGNSVSKATDMQSSSQGMGVAGSVPMPRECFTSKVLPPGQMVEVVNRCGNNYMFVYRKPGEDRCRTRSIAARSNEKFMQANTVTVVCIKSRGERSADSCSCPAGLEYTAETRPPPAAGGFPSDSDGCPVDKKDPRWGSIKTGDRCSF